MRTANRHQSSRRRRKRPILIQGVLFFLLVTLALYFFIHSAFFEVTSIQVEGNSSLTGEEIIRLSGLAPGINLWQLDERQAASRIANHPWVSRAMVGRRLPSTIVLRVEEREPLAIIPGGKGFILLDREGVYLESLTEISSLDLCVLSGAEAPSSLVPGQRLDAPGLKPALDFLVQWKAEIKELVAEINVAQPVSLIVYTREGLQVRMGDPASNMAHKIAVLKAIMADQSYEIKAGLVEYLDLSNPSSPVVKPVE